MAFPPSLIKYKPLTSPYKTCLPFLLISHFLNSCDSPKLSVTPQQIPDDSIDFNVYIFQISEFFLVVSYGIKHVVLVKLFISQIKRVTENEITELSMCLHISVSVNTNALTSFEFFSKVLSQTQRDMLIYLS